MPPRTLSVGIMRITSSVSREKVSWSHTGREEAINSVGESSLIAEHTGRVGDADKFLDQGECAGVVITSQLRK